MEYAVQRSADDAARRPAFSVSRGQQAKAGGRSREDRAAGKLACRRASSEAHLPLNSSGIVALVEEQWVTEVEKALSQAEKVTKHEVDRDSLEQVKTAVNPPSS